MSSSLKFPTIQSAIAGIDVHELAQSYGTPTYIYDAAKIVERVADLQAFDVVRFAQKACSNLAILNLVRRQGAVVDAVSAGEVRRALAAGYQSGGDPPGIVYTADIFDHESLDLAVELGLHVNCGSPEMIDQLGQRAPGSEVTLRVNPGFGHGHSQKTNTGGEQSKHGIWHTDLAECQQRAARHDITITGMHMHIGSGCDMRHLGQVADAMQQAVRQMGSSVRSISAGGGLSIPYRAGDEMVDVDAYYEIWNAARERLQEELGHAISLEIEPGRYLTAESGWLITEIRAVKRMGDNLFYLVDAGFNNLARPILYGAYHPMAIAPADSSSADRAEQDVVVGGPLCESGDIFTQQEGGFVEARPLPRAVAGDLLLIGCAGAYGAVMGSNYNSKPLAAEVLIQGGQSHLIRERQSFDDLVRGESIPEAD